MSKLLRLHQMRQCYFGQALQRSVSTLTPLATAFNAKPQRRLNFVKSDVGLFGHSELRQFEGFHLLRENVAERTDELIAEAISPNRSRKMVEIFDEMSDTLCRVADLAEFVRIAHPESKFAFAAEDACISICGIVENLNTHKPLFQALKHVVEQGDKLPTNEVDDHVAKLFLFDFEQCGIHLDEEQRQKVVRLNNNILQLGQKFMHGCTHPSMVPYAQVPATVRDFFPKSGENVVINGLCTAVNDVAAREATYKLYMKPNESQEELLKDLIACRHALARTCGFETYAHRAIKGSTMEHPRNVHEFIDEFSSQLRPRAAADFETMSAVKRAEIHGSSSSSDASIQVWDAPFYSTRLKRLTLGAETREYLPFFSLGVCMEGLNNLLGALYGVSLQYTELEPGESWHTDIYKLSVMHETEGLLGYIYCDFFEREGKPNQDCHFTIQGGKRLRDGSYQKPIVVVMLNLTPNQRTTPTLLSPSRVDNLFHEMGHAMHSMLARTQYQHVTGTRCCTDFAEVPSVLMEYFASDPRVLRTFARHYETQQPLSEQMLQRLCASKHHFCASEAQMQVFYSALDQRLHGDITKYGGNTTEVLASVQNKYYGLPYVQQTAWQLRFSHLVGYGAKYYSYLISRAIASWIWQTYFEANPLNRAAGEKYRREILAHGGGVPSRQLVVNFLQRDMTPKALADSLINEIDTNNLKMRDFTATVK